jgi:hypothetical protein
VQSLGARPIARPESPPRQSYGGPLVAAVLPEGALDRFPIMLNHHREFSTGLRPSSLDETVAHAPAPAIGRPEGRPSCDGLWRAGTLLAAMAHRSDRKPRSSTSAFYCAVGSFAYALVRIDATLAFIIKSCIGTLRCCRRKLRRRERHCGTAKKTANGTYRTLTVACRTISKVSD